MEKIFLRLREIAIEFPDGTIFGIGKLEPVTKGWVVKMKNATDFEGQQGMIKALNIAANTTQTVAGSKDGDVEVWDVVKIFNTEGRATKVAKENGQMTIYQIETATLRWLE